MAGHEMDTESSDYTIRHGQGTMTSWRYVPQKRRLLTDDPFYDDGNIHCSVQYKQMPIETERPYEALVADFQCQESGCSALAFNTIHDYEQHYNSRHRNVCSTCGRTFPSAHLLDIHVLEWHDVMFDILAQKQPMFLCLVEGCSMTFLTADKRKLHLVNEHKYPCDYRFDRRAKTKGKKTSEVGSSNDGTEGDPMEITASSNTRSGAPATTCTNRQHRIPKNICFGRGGARAFQRPRNKTHTYPDTHNRSKHSTVLTKEHSVISNPYLSQTGTESLETSECVKTDHGYRVESETMESEVTMETR